MGCLYAEKERRHGFNYWYSYGTFDEHKDPHLLGYRRCAPRPEGMVAPAWRARKVVSYLKNEGNVRDTKEAVLHHGRHESASQSLPFVERLRKNKDYNLYKDRPLDSLLIRPNVDLSMKKAGSAPFYFCFCHGDGMRSDKILGALKEIGADKNTIVIFASDHGETMCSQRTDDPKNSPYSESMNIPFIVRYPAKDTARVDNLLLSSPDIMPTVLGLCGLGDAIPSEVQGRNFAPLFFDEKADVVRPDAALYIQNMDGEKDSGGGWCRVASGFEGCQDGTLYAGVVHRVNEETD